MTGWPVAGSGNSDRYRVVASFRLATASSTVSPWVVVPVSGLNATMNSPPPGRGSVIREAAGARVRWGDLVRQFLADIPPADRHRRNRAGRRWRDLLLGRLPRDHRLYARGRLGAPGRRHLPGERIPAAHGPYPCRFERAGRGAAQSIQPDDGDRLRVAGGFAGSVGDLRHVGSGRAVSGEQESNGRELHG